MKKNIRQRFTRKPKKRKQTQITKPQNQNKQKGKLLERVIAALYESPGIKIEKNVQYPTTDGGRTREIDIILTANLEGLPVEYAFQCKNEAKPLDVNKIGEFVGALKDIGIPTKYGIFVSVNGFTEGAIAYAKKMGIRTLVLKGLSQDRLRSEINAALQHIIYLIPRVEEFGVTNSIDKAEYDWQFFMFTDENQNLVGTITDLIYNKWQNGEITEEIRDYEFELDVPEGWFQFYKNKRVEPQKITARVSIIAVVITIDGNAENFLLFNADTRQMEKFNTKVKFRQFEKGEVVPLTVFSVQKELDEFIKKSENFRLTIKTKLPRIIVKNIYYPLSKHVAEVVFVQMQKYGPDFSQITHEKFQQEIITASQNDLFRDGMFSLIGKEMPVICTDNDGETVDVTLLFENAEYDKVIALGNRYFKNPSKPLGNLIAWAYVEKSRQILNKSHDRPEDQRKRLIEESSAKVQAALEIEPGFIPAVDQFSAIYFAKKEYKKALQAVDYILKRQPEHIHLWVDQALALMKLKDWKSALSSINTAKELEIKRKDKTEHFPMILLRRANILYRLKKNEECWQEMLQVWGIDPEYVVENLSNNRLIDNVVNQVLSLEGILLLVEVLYFRAAEFIKQEKTDTAYEVAKEAIRILNSLMRTDQLENEPLVIGQLNPTLLEQVILRSVNRLEEAGDINLLNEQIEKIKIWFMNIYDEAPDFLETY